MKLLLVGDGPDRLDIEHSACQMGIRPKVIFAGSRADIPALMMGAMDVLVFPSRYEGLGLVAIEAQMAGLPSVLSDAIPETAIWRSEAVTVLGSPTRAMGGGGTEPAPALWGGCLHGFLTPVFRVTIGRRLKLRIYQQVAEQHADGIEGSCHAGITT